MKGWRAICVGIAVFAAVLPAEAATPYYVTTNGNDSVNDGLSWATAFLTISNAVAHATVAGDSVTVSNGTYNITTNISVTNGITVQSVNGPAATTVNAGSVAGRRVFVLGHSNAVVDGFTIRGGNIAAGFIGAGVYVTAGTLQNCTVSNNYSRDGGSGVYMVGVNIVVSNCTIRGNSSLYYAAGAWMTGGLLADCMITDNNNGYTTLDGTGGVRIEGGTVRKCVIARNSNWDEAGGMFMTGGLVQNCVIAANTGAVTTAANGGGLYMTGGRLENCTIARNVLRNGGNGDGVYLTGGAISNCIVYHNGASIYVRDAMNIYTNGGAVSYSCMSPLVNGAGNTAADPQFEELTNGNYRLLPGSPCIDTGATIAGILEDIEGTVRPLDGTDSGTALFDMGAYEAVHPTNRVFTCNFSAPVTEAFTNLQGVFTAFLAGPNTSITWYAWSLGDGSTNAGAGKQVVTNTYGPGFYDVSLTVSNTLGQATNRIKRWYVKVAPAIAYVATNGLNQSPYDTWGKAASGIKSAMDVAWVSGAASTLVLVSNGTYALSEQLLVSRDLVIQSVNGADATIINAGYVDQRRCFYVNSSNAVVRGFTMTRGRADSGGTFGSGVKLMAGTVCDCTISSNYSRDGGAGAWILGGIVSNCLIRNNGGASYKSAGIEMSGGIIQNCRIVSNTCINSADYSKGGGVALSGGTLRNCEIRGNTITRYGGGVYVSGSAAVQNCTVVRNTAGASYAGGGLHIEGGTVTNAIVYYNTAGSSNDISGATQNVGYSCSPDLTHDPAGTGNITGAPLFADTNALNYRLNSGSPCINAGKNESWMTGSVDLDGNRRVVRGKVDMGAYEVQPLKGTSFSFR